VTARRAERGCLCSPINVTTSHARHQCEAANNSDSVAQSALMPETKHVWRFSRAAVQTSVLYFVLALCARLNRRPINRMRPTAIYKLCKKTFKRSQGNTSNLTAHLKWDDRQQHQQLVEEDYRKKRRLKNRKILWGGALPIKFFDFSAQKGEKGEFWCMLSAIFAVEFNGNWLCL